MEWSQRFVALSKVDFTMRLRSFLSSVPEPCLLADYPHDLLLTKTALAGFDLDDETEQECGPVPRPIMSQMLKGGITQCRYVIDATPPALSPLPPSSPLSQAL